MRFNARTIKYPSSSCHVQQLTLNTTIKTFFLFFDLISHFLFDFLLTSFFFLSFIRKKRVLWAKRKHAHRAHSFYTHNSYMIFFDFIFFFPFNSDVKGKKKTKQKKKGKHRIKMITTMPLRAFSFSAEPNLAAQLLQERQAPSLMLLG